MIADARKELAHKTVDVLFAGSFAGFDPGETSGLVVVTGGRLRKAASLNQNELSAWLPDGHGGIGWDEFDAVVFEEFRIYPGAAQRLVMNKAKAAESAGIIKSFIPENVLHAQTASDIKGRDYLPETELVLAGYSEGRLDRHQRDALSHLFAYARRRLAKKNRTWKHRHQ
jgi:hypothetical protein